MGNCCAKRKHLVHPTQEPTEPASSQGRKDPSLLPSAARRIKVRMTAARFKELVSRADLSKGDGEIGRLILEECLKGTRHAHMISGLESKQDQPGQFRRLEAIAEEE